MYEPLPLFDCVFCVQDSSCVIKGVSKMQLHRNYFQLCLEQSNNSQMPVNLGDRTMTRYEPDSI